jgi:hypothetical protein
MDMLSDLQVHIRNRMLVNVPCKKLCLNVVGTLYWITPDVKGMDNEFKGNRAEATEADGK